MSAEQLDPKTTMNSDAADQQQQQQQQPLVQHVSRSRSHSRSRDRDDYERVARWTGRDDHHDQPRESDSENFTIYVTNLSYETTSEGLRAVFDAIGPVKDAQVVIEPTQHVSRGFAFVTMERVEDAVAALELNGKTLDGRAIRVEKARRKTAYEKTPGTYMGPSSHSAKYGTRRREDDRRGPRRDRDDFRDRERFSERDRDRGRERSRDREMFREREFRDLDRGRGPPPSAYDVRYREDRFRDFREELMMMSRAPPVRDARDAPLDFPRAGPPSAHFDPRDVRSASLGPPPYSPFEGRGGRGSPPREYRPMRSPPRNYRSTRSPPRMMDDRRFPPMDRQDHPSYGRGPRY